MCDPTGLQGMRKSGSLRPQAIPQDGDVKKELGAEQFGNVIVMSKRCAGGSNPEG